MPDKTKIRKYIRHPVDVPIQVSLDWADEDSDETVDQTITNIGLGGLAFVSQKPYDVAQRVRVCIPVLGRQNYLVGNVAWCEKSSDAYEIGLEFDSSKEMYRLRMIEQICHILHYRKEVAEVEGRELTTEEAAREWISKYAGDFPTL